MKRIFWGFTAGAVATLVFVSSFNIAVMIVDREAPITYQSARPLAMRVEQGGTIEVEYKVFRSRICPVVAKRWLYDANGVRHSVPQFTVGADLLAGRETYRRSITIPSAAAVGPAWYEVVLEYTCNPLQQLLGPTTVVSPPVRFSIVPASS
ncbi:hypothetical protein C8J36_103511 [Rhizobium sp. PP-F2F-G48]|uniref:hypothetical protein n=1 Tax=Rhizobium sp. PP-F2F-G48 TaxID=2135651 RepID=UPI00104E5F7F|nr:hypothetical protein [Rhizobium sp. PP-F2F-G48]TCM56141.1 hypothetical protein C8J36_103511 [Rhizobium sp. PP-F2F-G48]